MKPTALALAAAAVAVIVPDLASAQAGTVVVRGRVTQIAPADKSDPIPALGVRADAITVSDKTISEVDFTYFLTDNFAAELILTYPQRHDVSLNGTKIGSFKHLPPTLLAQYHFNPRGQFNPYVGAGINYTLISSVDLTVPGVGALDLEDSSVGYALQLGLDYNIDKNWSLNFDAKFVQIQSDVKLKATGATVSKVKVDPYLWSIGVGYRF
ncbi:MAG: OmpW family protein [Burkholderiales bacterium]|jgi:outer membrane protein|nr:OmpW family protein [Burkholderiales bacterium]